MESAVDMAGAAGNRLKAVLDNAKEFVSNVRDKAVAGAMVAPTSKSNASGLLLGS